METLFSYYYFFFFFFPPMGSLWPLSTSAPTNRQTRFGRSRNDRTYAPPFALPKALSSRASMTVRALHRQLLRPDGEELSAGAHDFEMRSTNVAIYTMPEAGTGGNDTSMPGSRPRDGVSMSMLMASEPSKREGGGRAHLCRTPPGKVPLRHPLPIVDTAHTLA